MSFPCREAGARPRRGLEHAGRTVLEKRRPDGCQELLHWGIAAGTVWMESEVYEKEIMIILLLWNFMQGSLMSFFLFFFFASAE